VDSESECAKQDRGRATGKDFGITLPYPGGIQDGFPPLVARAIVSHQRAKVGDVVTWTTEGEGGNGYYSFYWIGSDGLQSKYQTISIRYLEPGTKVGYVEITSNGETIVRRTEMKIVK